MRARSAFATILAIGLTAGTAAAQSPPSTPAPSPEASTPPPPPADPTRLEGRAVRATTPAPSSGAADFELTLPGEIQLRYTALSDIPLATTPGRSEPATLGQNSFFEHWFRFSPRISLGSRVRIITQFDVARLVLADGPTQQVGFSRDARNTELPVGVIDPRWVYLEWTTPVGLLRVGQQGFTSGLGILANDGARTPLFGDYRLGDIVERVALATRPGGRESNLVVAATGDLVYRDRVAAFADGDIALQGVLAVFWQDWRCTRNCERKRIGGYGAYRDIAYQDGSFLRVLVGNLYARWEWPQPDRVGRVFAGVEVAGIAGSTNVAQTQFFDRHDVIQFGAAGEVGIERDDRYRIALEAGYASGDSNPFDGAQRRFTFNPAYRVGMILFPEVVAWQTARSASIGTDRTLLGRPTRGAFLLPSSGGVTGAAYLYPTARLHLSRNLELRGAMVIATATADWVDPVAYQITGAPRNYRGGDASRRDLGVELDLGVNARYPISQGVELQGGLQGGVLFPGHAFDDAMGRSMGRVGMVTARAGIQF